MVQRLSHDTQEEQKPTTGPRAKLCDFCEHFYIEPCTLETQAKCPNMLAKRGQPGAPAQRTTMYLGSMDHSPSEQLVHPDQWHTTVLILSETGDHFALATNILQSPAVTPKKWSKSSQGHKATFESVLATGLDGVHIRAISSQGKIIEKSFDHMISEMGLVELVHTIVRNEKPYIEFGPFIRIKSNQNHDGTAKVDTEPATFSLARNQALPLIFICHFALRTHQSLLKLIQKEQPALQWMDWQLMPNRFPGDIKGPMGSLFHAIMSGAARQRLVEGNVRVATFFENAADKGSILADNIAGLLADKLKNQDFDRGWQPASPHGGMDWEIWS